MKLSYKSLCCLLFKTPVERREVNNCRFPSVSHPPDENSVERIEDWLQLGVEKLRQTEAATQRSADPPSVPNLDFSYPPCVLNPFELE